MKRLFLLSLLTNSLMAIRILVVGALMSSICLWAQPVRAEVTVVEFCDFQVPRWVAQANTTFTMAFNMDVGKDGEPVGIRTVESHFLDENLFIACIKRWRLPAPEGERVRVEFQWVHAKGWTTLSIMGTTFGQRLKIAPTACVATGK